MKTRFTDAEMDVARETELLEHLGYEVKRVGSYYTTKEMDSLRIKNRRTWFRYSEKGIAAQVVNAFLSAGLLYEDAEHHNCVFVGRNAEGRAMFAAKWGTCGLNGSSFQGDVPGSDKSIAFRLPCEASNGRVLVFEAPIDLMSYCILHREVRSNAVALCGLHGGALATYLRDYPHIRQITLCLDNDKWDWAAAERMEMAYTQKGYTVDIETPGHGKDWNEYLQQWVQSLERGR